MNLLGLLRKSVNRNLPFVEVPAKSSIPLFLVMFTSKQIYILNSRTSHHYHIIIILCVFVDKHKRILSRKSRRLYFYHPTRQTGHEKRSTSKKNLWMVSSFYSFIFILLHLQSSQLTILARWLFWLKGLSYCLLHQYLCIQKIQIKLQKRSSFKPNNKINSYVFSSKAFHDYDYDYITPFLWLLLHPTNNNTISLSGRCASSSNYTNMMICNSLV